LTIWRARLEVKEPDMDDETRREQGMRIRRQVLGDAHVDAAIERTTPVTEQFQDFITRYAWGDIWSRPRLDLRTRSLVTVALLAALGRTDELGMHLRGARRNGVSPDELSEVLLHTGVYAGLPTANTGLRQLGQVLDAEADG
jgi:4-carboxymuconolactone decarboxylase